MKEVIGKVKDKAAGDTDVLAVYLFGSRVREDFSPVSDFDICLILFPGECAGKGISEKRLEYVKMFNGKTDIQVFRQLPLYIRVRILKEGEVIFCRNEDLLYETAFKTIREFNDFEHIYREYLEEVLNG